MSSVPCSPPAPAIQSSLEILASNPPHWHPRAARAVRPHELFPTADMQVMERRRLARKELKNRVKQMEAALLSETRATLALEKELSTLKAQAPAEAQAQTQDAKPE